MHKCYLFNVAFICNPNKIMPNQTIQAWSKLGIRKLIY